MNRLSNFLRLGLLLALFAVQSGCASTPDDDAGLTPVGPGSAATDDTHGWGAGLGAATH